MTDVLAVLATLLAVVTMVTTVAHALEWPGKWTLRLDEYRVVQRIYYPGFTIAGGISEFPAIILTAVATALSEVGSVNFVLRAVALAALLGVHAVYWLQVHPVNRFWVEGTDLSGFGSGFFSFGSRRRTTEQDRTVAWTDLRDRWETGHATRAVLATIGVIALVLALA